MALVRQHQEFQMNQLELTVEKKSVDVCGPGHDLMQMMFGKAGDRVSCSMGKRENMSESRSLVCPKEALSKSGNVRRRVETKLFS